MRLVVESSHVNRDFTDGRLVVRLTAEDDARQLSTRHEIFFSVPRDFHAHNDLVAAIRQRDSAAIMQVMQRERCSALP